jgi:LDH2 family malate/lactate/ureidoglycolate dehydrogenase
MIRIARKELTGFCQNVFMALKIPKEEARDSAEILVTADARGIESHGVARMGRYMSGIRLGHMRGGVMPEVLRETPVSRVLDAQGAMGLHLSKKAMADVISRAQTYGVGFCSIRNSNHFGIAGYYAEMAARQDMIGVCMTNTAALGVPTFARDAMFGTNPIAVSVPANNNRLFTLDMATTCVTRGKVEVYDREEKPLPDGWAVNESGHVTKDASGLLSDMLHQKGGGLLPLGGEGEMYGGHKGYGLAVLVDIMTAVTSGGVFGMAVKDLETTSARVCHFFGAIRLDVFRDPHEFKHDMDTLLDQLQSARPAEDRERVYYAGLKEHESEAECEIKGVPLSDKVAESLKAIGKECGVPFPDTLKAGTL